MDLIEAFKTNQPNDPVRKYSLHRVWNSDTSGIWLVVWRNGKPHSQKITDSTPRFHLKQQDNGWVITAPVSYGLDWSSRFQNESKNLRQLKEIWRQTLKKAGLDEQSVSFKTRREALAALEAGLPDPR